jgi:hypothetical protein
MIPLTPARLIAAANVFVGLREQGGNNRGLMVELFLRGVNQQPGAPWCAAFVHHVGKWSHFDHVVDVSSWPLPATASCWMLGQFAKETGVLKDEPMAGDVFLQYKPELRRFGHAGIVANVVEEGFTPGGNGWFDCDTIEGNTNEAGERDGDGVILKLRRFYPAIGDRFIRWPDLDRHEFAGDPLADRKRVA